MTPVFAQTANLETRVVPTNLNSIKEILLDVVLSMGTQFIAHIPLLVIGLIILIGTWCVTKAFKFVLTKILQKRHIRKSLIELVTRLISIIVWMIGLLITGTVIFPGLTPASALGGLGLFSLAIGFAFKDIFENFFAGMLMLWKFPFENGDFIECQSIEGQVLNVSMRQTLIRKTSGEVIVVPNGFLFKNPVEVMTYKPERRVTIITGVAYSEDISHAVRVIEKAVKSCTTVKTEQPVQIFPQSFAESSIDIEVAWWTGARPLDIRRSRGEVVTAIKNALDNEGIEIPFPYRTLTFKENLSIRLNQELSQ